MHGKRLCGKGDLPVLVCAYVGRVSSLGDDSSLRPFRTVGVQLMAAVSLVVVLALAAFKAGVGLCAYTNSLTNLDEGDFWANAKSSSDNL